MNVLLYHILTVAQARAPVDTGNLRANGFELSGSTIIGGNDKVPYFDFTNAKGRNKGWFDNAVIQALRTYCERFGYNIKIEMGE